MISYWQSSVAHANELTGAFEQDTYVQHNIVDQSSSFRCIDEVGPTVRLRNVNVSGWRRPKTVSVFLKHGGKTQFTIPRLAVGL